MKIYLTEYQNGNKIYAGINIFAVDDDEAEALAREQGVTIVGEITEVKFKEEDLKDSKVKSTLTKCMIHYHPDKAKSANPAIFKAKDIYLRKEIAKIINSITNDMKGFD